MFRSALISGYKNSPVLYKNVAKTYVGENDREATQLFLDAAIKYNQRGNKKAAKRLLMETWKMTSDKLGCIVMPWFYQTALELKHPLQEKVLEFVNKQNCPTEIKDNMESLKLRYATQHD